MSARSNGSRSIGATETPDFAPERLRRIELDKLQSHFSLEEVEICSASISDVRAGSGCIRQAHLKDVELPDSKLRSVEFVDVAAERIDIANSDWTGARLRRVVFSDARLTGIELAEGQLEEVTFKGCRLDYANFRHSTIGQVSFKDCLLTGADFQGATIEGTLFHGCELIDVDFSKAKLSLVDLRGSKLALAGSVLLGGAIIDSLQLIELAPLLAHELGITVKDN